MWQSLMEHISAHPEGIPFACMVTNKIVRKPMWTRIFEGVMIAAIGTGLTLFVGLPMAVERVQMQTTATAAELQNHIKWAADHVNRRDALMREERMEALARDARMMEMLASIDRCLRERTCTK